MTNGNAPETNGNASETNGNGLLPCPCCGSAATVEPHLIEAGCTVGDQTWADWWTASVNCTSCALQFVGGGDTELEAVEDALKGWNTRAATTAQQFAWAVHDGRTWTCVEAAMESDALKPIPGFTRDSIYVDSMREYGEWMEKATALMRDMANQLPYMDNRTAEGLSEFGIEVGA